MNPGLRVTAFGEIGLIASTLNIVPHNGSQNLAIDEVSDGSSI